MRDLDPYIDAVRRETRRLVRSASLGFEGALAELAGWMVSSRVDWGTTKTVLAHPEWGDLWVDELTGSIVPVEQLQMRVLDRVWTKTLSGWSRQPVSRDVGLLVVPGDGDGWLRGDGVVPSASVRLPGPGDHPLEYWDLERSVTGRVAVRPVRPMGEFTDPPAIRGSYQFLDILWPPMLRDVMDRWLGSRWGWPVWWVLL